MWRRFWEGRRRAPARVVSGRPSRRASLIVSIGMGYGIRQALLPFRSRRWAACLSHRGARFGTPCPRLGQSHRNTLGKLLIEELQPRPPAGRKGEIESTEILPLFAGIRNNRSSRERLQADLIVVSKRAQHGDLVGVDAIDAGARFM